jgi:hypothetical protein
MACGRSHIFCNATVICAAQTERIASLSFGGEAWPLVALTVYYDYTIAHATVSPLV